MRKSLFGAAYNAGLVIAFLVAFPKICYKVFVHGKYRKHLGVRFGFGIPRISSGEGEPLIWFHGASVGEVRLLMPLIKKIFSEKGRISFVVTACSEAGAAEAERLYAPLGGISFILPLDLSLIIRPVVKMLRPDLVVFSEGDCWYNFLHAAKDIGAKAIVINGRMSEKSGQCFKVLKRIARNCFSPIDLFCLQDEVQKERFVFAGVPEEKIRVTGNIKSSFSTNFEENPFLRRKWREALEIEEKDRLLVLGSTHRTEEVLWMKAFQGLSAAHPRLKVLFVPRHLEKVRELEGDLKERNIAYGKWSLQENFSQSSVVIFDLVGFLSEIYAAADWAFVGGTFDARIGGHNLLEPLFREVPLLFGPYIFSQSEIGKKILKENCGFLLGNEKSLLEDVAYILSNREECSSRVLRGRKFLENEGYALEHTWQEIKSYIPVAKK